jgi:hypothetical protein
MSSSLHLTGPRDGIAVAQAYIHLKPFQLGRREFEKLYASSREVAIAAARKTYGPKHLVDIRAEEGSWKFWATVAFVGHGLLSAYDAVSKYPDFRQGMKELRNDAQEYGGEVLRFVLPRAGATPDQKEAALRRQMAPGSVYRLIKDLDSLDMEHPSLSKVQAAERMKDIEHRVRRLSSELPPADMEVIRKLIRSRGLPIPNDAFVLSEPLVAKREDEYEAAFPNSPHISASHQPIRALRNGEQSDGRLIKHEIYNVTTGRAYQ